MRVYGWTRKRQAPVGCSNDKMKENWQVWDTEEVGMRLVETLRLLESPVVLTQQDVESCPSQLMLAQLDNYCT